MFQDPVNGELVEPEKSVGTRKHGKNTFYFSSQATLDEFDADPHRYGHPERKAKGNDGHGHHH